MQSRTCLHRTLTRTDIERVFALDDLSTSDAFNGNLTLRDDGVWRREFPDLHLNPMLGREERLALLEDRARMAILALEKMQETLQRMRRECSE